MAVGTEAMRLKENLQATLAQKGDLALQASKLSQARAREFKLPRDHSWFDHQSTRRSWRQSRARGYRPRRRTQTWSASWQLRHTRRMSSGGAWSSWVLSK